jgi:hypothetical protein
MLAQPIQTLQNFLIDISNRLHNNLVIKPIHKKILPTAGTKLSNRKAPPAPTAANINALQAKSILAPTCVPTTNDQILSPSEPNALDEAIIIKGTKKKKHILNAYEEHFGSEFDHWIVSKKKGNIKQDPDFICSFMKPSLSKWYQVSKVLILNVIMTVIKEHLLLPSILKKLCLLNKTSSTMIPKVLKWVPIDFHPLQEHWYNYEQQDHIDTSRVEIASAAMIHFGLDPGKFVCFLGGDHTGYSHNIPRTLSAVKDHISPEDLAHMKQILLEVAPQI